MTAAEREAPPFIYAGTPPQVRRTVGDAFRLVARNPANVLGPLFVIQLPIACITAGTTAVLYLTAFSDREVVAPADILSQGDRQQLFTWIVAAAVDGLFALVARGATIVAIAGVARGRPGTLTAALDPAFTRLGGLILLILIIGAGSAALFASVIGIPILILLAIRLGLAFDTFMLEGRMPLSAIGASWNITSGHTLRLAGAMILGLLAIAPVIVFASALAGITGEGRTAEVITIALIGIVQTAILMPAVAVFTAVTTLFYLNLKANADARPTA